MSEARIILQKPLPHQVRELARPERFKLWCWGRRTGKSRGAVVAGVTGHGPVSREGAPLHRGILSGGDVVWLAPDYPQSDTIWNETLIPRFAGVPGVHIDQKHHDITLPNGGALRLRTGENPDAVRGSGERLFGVILDEFAHTARAEYTWRSVVRPALMDNGAWAIWCSTPKRGSYFNDRALSVKRGERSTDWHLSQMDARQNPRIAPEEFAELVAEYPTDSDDVREEVFAELLEGGAGLAFPEFDRGVHVVPAQRTLPLGWRYAAGLDWGYTKGHGAYVLVAFGPEGVARVVYERRFVEEHARQAAKITADASRHHPPPEWIVYDVAMEADGRAISGESVATEYLAGLREAYGAGTPMWIAGPHAAGSRATRKNLLHRLLGYRFAPDGTLPPWSAPRLTISDQCPDLTRVLERLPRDPKKADDVDTKADDHLYDALTYLLASDPPRAVAPTPTTWEDKHPGFTAEGDRKDQPMAPWERMLIDQVMGAGPTADQTPGTRYSVPRTWDTR